MADAIKINGAHCLLCNTIIYSTHRHDFKYCKCHEDSGTRIGVDGGLDYIKRSYGSKSKWIEVGTGKLRNIEVEEIDQRLALEEKEKKQADKAAQGKKFKLPPEDS